MNDAPNGLDVDVDVVVDVVVSSGSAYAPSKSHIAPIIWQPAFPNSTLPGHAL